MVGSPGPPDALAGALDVAAGPEPGPGVISSGFRGRRAVVRRWPDAGGLGEPGDLEGFEQPGRPDASGSGLVRHGPMQAWLPVARATPVDQGAGLFGEGPAAVLGHRGSRCPAHGGRPSGASRWRRRSPTADGPFRETVSVGQDLVDGGAVWVVIRTPSVQEILSQEHLMCSTSQARPRYPGENKSHEAAVALFECYGSASLDSKYTGMVAHPPARGAQIPAVR